MKTLPIFFEDVPIQAGGEVALYASTDELAIMEWLTTIVVEVDTEHQRLRCLSYKAAQYYRQVQTEEKRQWLLSNPWHTFWYDKYGRVLSPTTWQPRKRNSFHVNLLKAGTVYPLTDELRKVMRISVKRGCLNIFTGTRLYMAIRKGSKEGGIDEERLDFLLDWLERGLAKMTEQFGDNGADPWNPATNSHTKIKEN